MFRRLLLSASCLVGLAMAVSAQEPGRRVFTYNNPGIGHGTFTHTRGMEWVEKSPLGDRHKFRETVRNNEFVEMFDKSRKVRVRIYATQYAWKFQQSSKAAKGRSDGKLKGRWTD